MRRGFLLGLRAGVVVATMTTTAACSGSSPSSPLGIVADAGFRPNSNGFTFENYGQVLASGLAPTNLTASDVEALFGSQVCADAKLRRCDLIPEAQAWLTSTNQAMAGGHCYGFSVLAELHLATQAQRHLARRPGPERAGHRREPGPATPDRLRLGTPDAGLGARPSASPGRPIRFSRS